MTYSAREITQEIMTKETTIPNVSIMEAVDGKGHLVSLQKPYLKELHQYLIAVKENPKLQEATVVFLAENPLVARQACAIWKKELEKAHQNRQRIREVSYEENVVEEEEEMAEEYDYDYFTIEEDLERESVIDNNEIVVVTKKHRETKSEASYGSFLLAWENGSGSEKRVVSGLKTLIDQTDTMLLEIMDITDPDELVEYLLQIQVPHMAISMMPKDSYKYVLKRLSFEGNIYVINLGKPTIEDYMDYGKRFIQHCNYSLEQEEALKEAVVELASYRGTMMKEGDVYHHLRKAFQSADLRKETVLRSKDVKLNYYGMENPMEELETMIGLENAKKVLQRYLAAKRVMKGDFGYHHLIFAGHPGTGKSCLARIFAAVMGKLGLANGKFKEVSRADLIGQYVGHTAARIQKIFEEADGGVLFLDEASFLLGKDDFVKEAVIELVRFMELYPQTTVIFATYPEEARKLLQCDPGLASRIYQTIPFENYSKEQLWEIAKIMAKKYDFIIQEECREWIDNYMEDLRDDENYGNAREVRKLLQAAMEEYGLAGKIDQVLDTVCFQKAIQFLAKKEEKKAVFGFHV